MADGINLLAQQEQSLFDTLCATSDFTFKQFQTVRLRGSV